MVGNSGQIDWHHWILRLIAIIIDGVIISIPIWLIYNFLIVPAISMSVNVLGFTAFVVPWWGSLVYLLVVGLVMVLYFVILEIAWGATIGKRLLKLQVQMVNGSKLTFDKSFIRNVSKFFGLVIIDWLVAILTPGQDGRQKYTDRIAGTTVAELSQPGTSEPPPPPPPPPP